MIVARLRTIISYFGITPSALADSIGVPRSSVSHLLSGRNKPSMDFVLKLVKQYPEVNLYWLLNGKEEFPTKTNLERSHNEKDGAAQTIDKTPLTQLNNEDKPIEKIVVLYQDGTFETYTPK